MVNLNGTLVNTEQELEAMIADWSEGAKRMARSAFHGTPFEPLLEDKKLVKKQEIDQKTKELIALGFEFDGHTFSLSETAQINWASIKSNKDVLTFPLAVTANGDSEYELQEIDVDAFTLAAINEVHDRLASGRSLKLQVDAATTEEELNLVIDNR